MKHFVRLECVNEAKALLDGEIEIQGALEIAGCGSMGGLLRLRFRKFALVEATFEDCATGNSETVEVLTSLSTPSVTKPSSPIPLTSENGSSRMRAGSLVSFAAWAGPPIDDLLIDLDVHFVCTDPNVRFATGRIADAKFSVNATKADWCSSTDPLWRWCRMVERPSNVSTFERERLVIIARGGERLILTFERATDGDGLQAVPEGDILQAVRELPRILTFEGVRAARLASGCADELAIEVDAEIEAVRSALVTATTVMQPFERLSTRSAGMYALSELATEVIDVAVHPALNLVTPSSAPGFGWFLGMAQLDDVETLLLGDRGLGLCRFAPMWCRYVGVPLDLRPRGHAGG